MGNFLKRSKIRTSGFWQRNAKSILYSIMVISLLIILLMLSVSQAKTERLAEDINHTLKNTNDILLRFNDILLRFEENTEDREDAVEELLVDNRKQTELIICLLAVHGDNIAITEIDEDRCRVLVFEAREDQQEQRTEAGEETSVETQGEQNTNTPMSDSTFGSVIRALRVLQNALGISGPERALDHERN